MPNVRPLICLILMIGRLGMLISEKISFISNIWVITCRNAINNDKNSRYLVCIEGVVINSEYEKIVENINSNISIINVKFDEENKNISINNIKTNQSGVINYQQFKNRIIEITKCEYIESFALGSSESSPLSRFFREHMGKAFALTDIDFYLTGKQLFIEEKNFVLKDKGYIGIGQCISFKEIINDIFCNVKLIIVCIDNDQYQIADLNNINCGNFRIIDGWGKMVEFEVRKIIKTELINLIK